VAAPRGPRERDPRRHRLRQAPAGRRRAPASARRVGTSPPGARIAHPAPRQPPRRYCMRRPARRSGETFRVPAPAPRLTCERGLRPSSGAASDSEASVTGSRGPRSRDA
jgi:hypothetical protein